MPETIEQFNCGEVMTRLEQIRDRAWDFRDRLLSSHSTWDREVEARVTGLSRFGNVLTSIHACFFFLAFFLMSERRPESQATNRLSPEDRAYYLRVYTDFIRNGFLVMIFSTIESSFRSFLRGIDANACSGATDAFKNIYTCLLRTKLSLTYPDGLQLLDLARLTRNTIHNNGIHFGQNESVAYKGVTYEFQNGGRIDFVTVSFLIMLAEDLLQVLIAVVGHPTIQSITTQITEL